MVVTFRRKEDFTNPLIFFRENYNWYSDNKIYIYERRKTMKNKKKTKAQQMDEEIKNLLEELNDWQSTSDNYEKVLNRIERLSKLRKQERRISDVDIAQLFGSTVNLLSILSIINYERVGVITTKAFGIFMKGVK